MYLIIDRSPSRIDRPTNEAVKRTRFRLYQSPNTLARRSTSAGLVLDQSTAPDGTVRFKEVIASFERKLKKLPIFRTRLVQVPGGYDRPYWIKDDNFDMEFHTCAISPLPKPRRLASAVSGARLHARPIDMSRPLWEGRTSLKTDNIPHLPKNCFAVYTKMHHSLVDGAGGSSFMAALATLSPSFRRGGR
ncbi:MAG: wax ester/triacylglycerol synthase family O-acyltransferase [Pseudomonadales bacterium]